MRIATQVVVTAALLMGVPGAMASTINQAYCISFEPSTSDVGFLVNSCNSSLDVTWCHSDSTMACTQQWKSSGVQPHGRSTVSLSARDRASAFKLIYACERGSSECLTDSERYKRERSR